MEEKFYRVCELEDKVQSFVELSVAAVPDIWIVKMIDGSNFCYWPMEDATMKIRTFANPNEGGKWKSYKCRILMNGGTIALAILMIFIFSSRKISISEIFTL